MAEVGYLLIDGIDIQERFGCLILKREKLDPPQPKLYTVDIPGGDGSIDLTEFAGFPVYKDREMVFRCYLLPGFRLEPFTAFIQGHRYEFRMSWEDDYIYRGRFHVEGWSLKARTFSLVATADPFKTLGLRTYYTDAFGGKTVILPNGSGRVVPTVEVRKDTVISMLGESWRLVPGTWEPQGFWLRPGENVVEVDSAPDEGDGVWTDWQDDTWEQHEGERLSGLTMVRGAGKWPDVGTDVQWSEKAELTWADLAGEQREEGEDYRVYFRYEWRDL